MTCQAHPVLVKIRRIRCINTIRSFKIFGPPVDGPKDPWPCVLSLPERFVGDPASLASDNIFTLCTPPQMNEITLLTGSQKRRFIWRNLHGRTLEALCLREKTQINQIQFRHNFPFNSIFKR